jgi:predicted secreted protein
MSKEEKRTMNDKIGKIKETVDDARSGKLMFVCHCLLNQNACVRGIASEPAAIRPLVTLLLDNDVALYQMPCPEMTYYGSMRWGQVKKQYSTPMFRKHCRELAEGLFDQVESYLSNGHEVIGFVMRDGSPTCGLNRAAVSADKDQVWGGMVWHIPLQRFAQTQGVFCEVLQAEAKLRGITDILFMSLPEVEEAGSFKDSLAQIQKAITT